MADSMFTPAKLRATVEETLANTDVDLQGKQGAFLLVADLHGVKAVTAIRVGNHWSNSGVGETTVEG